MGPRSIKVPLALLLFGLPLTHLSARQSPPKAVPTFECVGIYWSPTGGSEQNECRVAYMAGVNGEWREALPLWFDRRNAEYRGSIVGLHPGTSYEIRLSLKKPFASATLTTSTWREGVPIAKTISLPMSESNTYAITDGGTKDGYVLHTSQPRQRAVIDVGGKENHCLTISAPFVIIRGLSLRNAGNHGIRLLPGAHDVIIEDCDISGWGSPRNKDEPWGRDCESAIYAEKIPSMERITIQHNRLHDPRFTSNSWKDGHPQGPQAISFIQCGGNHVIRHNEVCGNREHMFNDGIGGGENYSLEGFPNRDSDIYGNFISDIRDDGIEVEGGDCNVRIWGNYIDATYTGIASACCAVGLLNVFRNVMGVSRCSPEQKGSDIDEHGPFGKLGDNGEFGGGRRYFFHNTLLQPVPKNGEEYTLGAGGGLVDSGGAMSSTVSRNNVWQVHKTWWPSVRDSRRDPGNDLDYDLCNGKIVALAGAEAHGVRGLPVYAPGNGPESGRHGNYRLDPSSPGVDQGVRIPNFNDGFSGPGPDIGAQESGSPSMKFGADVDSVYHE